jgi:YVTN family beta-propeller protein
MTRNLLFLAICGFGLLVANKAEATDWKFEDAKVGELPTGWTSAKTGQGPGSVWKILEDSTAPAGSKVLAQTSPDGPNGLFNLCVAAEPKLVDVDLSVSLKAVAGKTDQGGGLVWRYQDADNYYVVRLNPLEGDFRLFHVVKGKRTQLGKTVVVDEAVGKWHTIRVLHEGEHIQCFLNGKRHFDIKDGTIRDAGQIGLWTKADAASSFDAVAVIAPFAAGEATDLASPRQVLVVNTQDASVSLVDLASMREVKRHPVGPRPYGIAVAQDGKSVAVGVEDEEQVKFFSLPDFTPIGAVRIGKMFNDHIVLSQDGKQILVANFYSDDVVIIDVASMKEVGRITGCSAPHVVKFGPLRKNLYVTCKKITGIAIVDPMEGKLVKFHQLNVNPRSLTFSADETKVYFGSFWVNGFFQLDTETGKVTRLFVFDPPADNAAPQEVTYHGVEAVLPRIVLAANEGRSYVDSVDVETGKLLDRLTTVSKPCCVEHIPGSSGGDVRVLVSNIGDGTLQLVEVSKEGKLKSIGSAKVGAAPKRVAFVPALKS